MQRLIQTVVLGLVVALIPANAAEGSQAPDDPPFLSERLKELDPYEVKTITIFRKASRSAVFITNKKRTTVSSLFSFERQEVERTQGQGSGFVWDKEGHIVTNFHVIYGATSLIVTLSDHTTWEAELVGTAPHKDIAVLKIYAPTDKLKPLEIGSSSNLIVGQKVLAIGNPFGLDQTLTTGVVSALSREIKSIAGGTIHDVIQTDAAINPGNSGGPLLDSKGRLIGVNAAIVSQGGLSSGIGFAIPVNAVSEVVPQLIEHGAVVRPGLGITILNENYRNRFGSGKGIIIQEVNRNSAAQRAGLQGLMQDEWGRLILGDVIIGIDEHPIRDYNDLVDALDCYKVGDTVTVKILQGGREKKQAEVKLQAVR